MALSRKEQRRQQLAKQRRKRRLMIGIPIGVLLVLIAALVYSRFLVPIEGLREEANLERGHDESIEIPDEGLPPIGGVHNPRWLNCGIYREPVETELALHSLEHGAIWIAYQPELPQEQIDLLEEYADSYTLVAPYPGLASKIVLSAWGAQLELDEVPDPRVDRFISRYKGQGPEAGATCSNGVGTPVN